MYFSNFEKHYYNNHNHFVDIDYKPVVIKASDSNKANIKKADYILFFLSESALHTFNNPRDVMKFIPSDLNNSIYISKSDDIVSLSYTGDIYNYTIGIDYNNKYNINTIDCTKNWTNFADISGPKIYPITKLNGEDSDPEHDDGRFPISKFMCFNQLYSAFFINHHDHHINDVDNALPETFRPHHPVVIPITADVLVTHTFYINNVTSDKLSKYTINVPLVILPTGQVFLDFTHTDLTTIRNLFPNSSDGKGLGHDDYNYVRKVLIKPFNYSYQLNVPYVSYHSYFFNSDKIQYEDVYAQNPI